MQYYIHIIITIIFSLLFPHYYHCPYYPTTITHYWHHAYNHKNDRNNNESDSNDDLKNLWKSKAIKIIASNILWTKDRGENWANKQTKKWEQLVFLSETNKSNVTQTRLRCYSNVCTSASTPQLNVMSRCHSLGLPSWLRLLLLFFFRAPAAAAGAMVWKKGGSRLGGGGVALKDYVVLTRLSSCLMAVRREKKVCHIWELYIISVVYFCFLTKLMYTVRHMQRYCEQ